MTAPPTDPADWRAALDGLVPPGGPGGPGAAGVTADGRAARPPARTAPTPLALQLELRHRLEQRPGQWRGPKDEPATRLAEVDRLAARPMTRGARGAWVKQGLTWQNVAYQGEAGGYDPAHARWFAQFALLKGGNPGVYNPYGSDWITLDEYESPVLWALLAEAVRLGIPFVGGEATPTVRVLGAAELGFDASIDDGGLRLAPVARFAGARPTLPVPLGGVRLIGRHGLYRAGFERGALELAPLAQTPSAAQLALLARPETVRVPPGELAEFTRTHYFALAKEVPVASADGSFEPPPAPPAELVLQLRYETGDAVRAAWNWRFADGRVAEAGAADAEDGDERADAERDPDLVARVLDVLGWVPFEAVVLRGIDAARFVAERLPELERLAETRRLVIEERGERPDYRELLDPPELRVTMVESPKADWLDLGVVVTVNGKPVPFLPLFRALAQGRKRLLLVDRSYLSLELAVFDELRALIAEAEGIVEWEAGLRMPREQALALYADFEDLAEFEGPALAWRALVAALRPAAAPAVERGADASAEPGPIEPPAGLALPLRPYQLDGYRWLARMRAAGLGAVLADDMGLGKTAQALALVARAAEEGAGPFLVVAPTSVASNWVAEAARFVPGLRVARLTSTERTGRLGVAEAAASADLVVTSYAVLRLEAARFAEVAWGGLVLDEAQFVKNPKTRVHEAARAIRAPFVLALTGTPIENHLGELWAILRLVAPGLFPSRRGFDERYRRPIEDDGNAERLAKLRRRIRPFLLRRTKELVAPELPEKQEQTIAVELSAAHRRVYDATLQRERQKLLDLVKDESGRFILYRSLTLLRMLALDPGLIDPAHDGLGSAKLDALLEQLEELREEGHRAIVFSQFTSFLGRAAARLEAAGIPFALLDGSTPVARRDAEAARFRAGEARVFLISLKAGGFGLNLVEADYVFLLDPWWNPASEQQAIDRAHRIGRTERVMVYRLVSADTIEEKVLALQARKGELVAGVLGAGVVGAGAAGAAGAAATEGSDGLAPDDVDFAEPRFSADELRALLDD
ncbi:DEAD/DEAH box helicase [Agromyces mediolanus]|uniref:DEAD/DEAH box helicase n=1 Tax=Agromyces mediolanus TaxID=41986 RepID=UPI00203CA032|nr:DEAD/DEAH box helicase [Agromyces mediolanus]MCM3657993.1 DEAD/DEAH box helicase [Agromyces mediolanus]